MEGTVDLAQSRSFFPRGPIDDAGINGEKGLSRIKRDLVCSTQLSPKGEHPPFTELLSALSLPPVFPPSVEDSNDILSLISDQQASTNMEQSILAIVWNPYYGLLLGLDGPIWLIYDSLQYSM